MWSEKKGDKDLASAKQKCIDHIRLSTGLLIDTPTGIAGNTNSGPMADRFFFHAVLVMTYVASLRMRRIELISKFCCQSSTFSHT